MADGRSRLQSMQKAEERPQETEIRRAFTRDPIRCARHQPKTSRGCCNLSGPVPQTRNCNCSGCRHWSASHHSSGCALADFILLCSCRRSSQCPRLLVQDRLSRAFISVVLRDTDLRTPAFSGRKIRPCPTPDSSSTFDTGDPETWRAGMNLELLTKRHFRLTQELAVEYRARPWVTSRIDRIANDIAATERAIAELHSSAEHDESIVAFRSAA